MLVGYVARVQEHTMSSHWTQLPHLLPQPLRLLRRLQLLQPMRLQRRPLLLPLPRRLWRLPLCVT